MTNDHINPPYPSEVGMCDMNGRRVFWTGRVAIGLQFEAPTPPSPDTLPILISLLIHELKELFDVD